MSTERDDEAQSADVTFDRLVERYASRLDVPPPQPGRHFGSAALKVNGSIFAMAMDGRLVLKLPAPRVAELITTGPGEPFGTGGRAMREWVSLPFDGSSEALTDEAYEFVGSATPSAGSKRRSR